MERTCLMPRRKNALTAESPAFRQTVRNTAWCLIHGGENLILQNFNTEEFSSHGILKKDKIESHAKELVRKFDVRPADCENRPAGTLSEEISRSNHRREITTTLSC